MARQPFNLKAYLALNRDRSGSAPALAARPARPEGRLVWAHADSAARQRALVSICKRIRQQRPRLAILTTGAVPEDEPNMSAGDLPSENLTEINAFLDFWSPDMCLWSSQSLRPALLHLAAERGCGLTLIDADDRDWTTPAARWIPDLAPVTLSQFDAILATDEQAERRLRRMGLAPDRLSIAGPLTEAAVPPDCSIRLHEELAALLVGRPLWLAARIRPEEVGLILKAHGRASRLAHRLLLFLVPDNVAEADAIAAQVDASGFRVCHWEAGEMPDDNSQIVLASGPDELGLWYRLSPLALMGGSLLPGRHCCDPLEAAALGSAILYGPSVGRHLASYRRLADVGAARIVRDVDTLSAAVSQLIAPDHAAAMAHAGWDIVSAGAAMTDRIVDIVLDRLDRLEAR